MGACTFASNGAQVLDLPWASAPSDAPDWPAGVQTTYIAMNAIDWGLSAACGTCLWFKSQGASPPSGLHAMGPTSCHPYPCLPVP
jgi:hypothetical protein